MNVRKYVPREYQKLAADLIIKLKGSLIILDMGLGKTVATLTAIDYLMYESYEINKVLIIAPKKVADSVWDAEAAKWEHLRYLKIAKILGSAKERMNSLKLKADIYIINVDNFIWLNDLFGQNWPFDMVVVDESSLFKSHQAKRFKVLKKIAIKKIVLLTGTPRPNTVMDLWSQVYLIDKGKRLGRTIGEYRRKYFLPGASSGHIVYEWRPKKGAEDEIYRRIADISLSVRASDYPDRLDNIINVKLLPEAKAKYSRMEKDMLLPLQESDIVANNAAALSNKLLQMANGCVYDDDKQPVIIHDAKLDKIQEIIETSCGNPLLIFYWFKHDLKRLKERFPLGVELKSSREIKDWNEGKIDLMFAHPASSGHGLNLQFGGHIIIWFSLTWSLELYQQANARLYRQGQQESVIIHHLVAEGTIDERVMKALEDKKTGQDRMIEAVKARVKALKGGVRNDG